MILNIVITVFVLLAALLIYAATRPDTFRVQRSTTIKAAPVQVFAFINDFHQWVTWSPWEKMDPAMKRTYSGAATGQGTIYEWEGNKVGKGRMEIMESSPAARILIKLDFFKPFEAHNTAEFILQAQGEQTEVTWAMYGPSSYMTKLIHLFISMDGMVGKDFETGLANLKSIAEK